MHVRGSSAYKQGSLRICILYQGRLMAYKCRLLTQYILMTFATLCTLYNVLNDTFQALITYFVPIPLM